MRSDGMDRQDRPERPTNRLQGETSPYLRQHARNPVDWFPWGEEALSRARGEDKAIFLSVGYSSCHWCHVMERESFEDDEIADFMNEHFINVKVDREERPDIDSTYMAAVQLLTGSGGWPMSVFLTPDLRPFWGGTYFPPRARWGRPGFLDVLREIDRVYNEDRTRVDQSAAQIVQRLVAINSFPAAEELPGKDAIDSFVQQAIRSFDARWGGFGAAPKFPRSLDLSLLFCVHARTGSEEVLQMCEKTLEGMALGGIYDQVGGGFHRYSTDARWLVPHFEKMLYDNALLARTYTEAWQITRKPIYSRIACEVLDYVLREMTSPEGGFYSATDADSEGEEGKFFVWTVDQIEAVLGVAGARVFCAFYDVTEKGNFENRSNIPHVSRSLEEVAETLELDPSDLEQSLRKQRSLLYEKREEREKPFRDEKVITAWNALMTSAFARGYQVFREDRYLEAARSAERFLRDRLRVNGRLQRTYMEGQAKHDGYLDDHSYLVEALLDLYEATLDERYLIEAQATAEHIMKHFHDDEEGGFFFTATYHEELNGRRKEIMDNATPAAAGVVALSFVRLERIMGNPIYRQAAEEVLRTAAPLIARAPAAFASSLLALDFLLHSPVEIVSLGVLDESTLRALHEPFMPGRVIVGRRDVEERGALELPLLVDKQADGERPLVWVCRDLACSPPTNDPERVRSLLG